MRRRLTDGGPGTGFWQVFLDFEQSAWRWEQQPTYHVGYEREQFDKFLAGNPESPFENKDLGEWMNQVATQVAEGKTVGRVRILDTPPTDYQRWMLWLDQFNREAGESIDYLSRARAREVGLIPASGPHDWWLFDDERLVLMHIDDIGRRVKVELLVDEPEVEKARHTRDLALKAVRDVAKDHPEQSQP